jgi:hypothetical protein
MRSVIDLDIANLVPLEGDIAIEDLATKAGVDPDLLGIVSFPLFKVLVADERDIKNVFCVFWPATTSSQKHVQGTLVTRSSRQL